MARTIEKIEKLSLPVIPLRGLVAFPSMPINFELQREISINALNCALERDMYIFMATQKDISVEEPTPADRRGRVPRNSCRLFCKGRILHCRHNLKERNNGPYRLGYKDRGAHA